MRLLPLIDAMKWETPAQAIPRRTTEDFKEVTKTTLNRPPLAGAQSSNYCHCIDCQFVAVAVLIVFLILSVLVPAHLGI